MKQAWLLLSLALLMALAQTPRSIADLNAQQIKRRVEMIYSLPECREFAIESSLVDWQKGIHGWGNVPSNNAKQRLDDDCRVAIQTRAQTNKENRLKRPTTIRVQRGNVVDEVPQPVAPEDRALETP